MWGTPDHYDYLFHFNHHTGLWNAFPRDKMKDYFNGTYKKEDGLLSAKHINLLILAVPKQKTHKDIL